VAGIAGGLVDPGPAPKVRGRRRAAGIYGAIITASVIDSSGDHLHTATLVIAVVVTLVVYWLAEQYAEVLGEQSEHGLVPTWDYIRGQLVATWPMVSASFVPLLVLVVARLAGESEGAAASIGLAAAVLLLMIYAFVAARSAQLHGVRLVFATSVAALLGLVMILLKELIILLH
jgi:hypothetical protein